MVPLLGHSKSPAIPLQFRCAFPCNSAARQRSGIRLPIFLLSMTCDCGIGRETVLEQGFF
jgi:hypothetical protein